MGSKNKKKGRGRRSKTPGQTSASNPNPTATSPSVSTPTGDATTTSLFPSSAFPSAPPTTTPQVVPSASPQPTSILASSASQITTTQPLPSAPPPPPPPPVQETHQEFISCTSEGCTTTDLPGPSTAPSESAASTRTSTLMPITNEYLGFIAPTVACALTALKSLKEDDPADMQELIVDLFGLKLDEMESVLGSLRGLAEIMKDSAALKVALEALSNMEGLRSAVKLTETLLAERKKRHGSGGSCGGSKGGGGSPDSGSPDSGSGEGDGEGGGVGA